MDRYEVGSTDEFEPGSNETVLRNKLGVTDSREIGLIESKLLQEAILRSFENLESTTKLRFDTVCQWHVDWLGSLYVFAGQIRTVNVSKGGVLFAPISNLETTLEELDKCLGEYTPCNQLSQTKLVKAIAEVNCEFILAHPFREGNGRIGRWIADVMALQAGYELLNWRFDQGGQSRQQEYFSALRQSFGGNLTALEEIVESALVGA